MNAEQQIATQLATQPFRPFALETIGGSQIQVERPQWLYRFPDSGGEFVVFTPRGVVISNYEHIVSITVGGSNGASNEPD